MESKTKTETYLVSVPAAATATSHAATAATAAATAATAAAAAAAAAANALAAVSAAYQHVPGRTTRCSTSGPPLLPPALVI